MTHELSKIRASTGFELGVGQRGLRLIVIRNENDFATGRLQGLIAGNQSGQGGRVGGGSRLRAISSDTASHEPPIEFMSAVDTADGSIATLQISPTPVPPAPCAVASCR